MPSNPKIQEYFAKLAPTTRRELRQLRTIIREAAPGAEEHFSYGIPGFRLDGKPLVWYAGWKEHTSIYPITGALRTAHAKALAGYAQSKGTVRFPLNEPLPTQLVRRLVKGRVAEVRTRGK
jgi:uncharacterized protein YdhG (YjbR/CyaY superfamily)